MACAILFKLQQELLLRPNPDAEAMFEVLVPVPGGQGIGRCGDAVRLRL